MFTAKLFYCELNGHSNIFKESNSLKQQLTREKQGRFLTLTKFLFSSNGHCVLRETTVCNVVFWFMAGREREPQTWTWMAIWGLLEVAALAGSWDICGIRRRVGVWVIGLSQFRSAAAATNKQETGSETEQKDWNSHNVSIGSRSLRITRKSRSLHTKTLRWYGY